MFTTVKALDMNRKNSIDKIAKYLGRFVEEVKSYNDSGLYDINIHSENALIPILNAVFDLQLQNANSVSKKNFPAVDLIDLQNRIAFQVTATAGIEKIKDTLKKFGNHNLKEYFDTLYVFILTGKEKKYSEKIIKENTPEGLDFNQEVHIMDMGDFRNRITYIQALDKLQHISRLCEHEFSDVQIDLRQKKYQLGYLKAAPELLYPNFVEISFPNKLFVADVSIDVEAAKDKINNWRESKGWRKKKKFKQGELLRNEMIEREVYDSEWLLRENKIHTFRNLHDSKESLAQFIDKGTIVEMWPYEYYSTSEAHLSNFKNLLKSCLIQLCRKKGMEWVNDDEIIRYRNFKEKPAEKKLRWKGKNESTKTVIFEMKNKALGHIVCFRSMAFRPSFELYGNTWYLVINPTWSFTNPGGFKKSQFESKYMAGLKRQENNNAVYYQFRFFAYQLAYHDLFDPKYQYLSVKPIAPLEFSPSIEDSKWLPPKEFEPKNEFEQEIKIDKELNQLIFD